MKFLVGQPVSLSYWAAAPLLPSSFSVASCSTLAQRWAVSQLKTKQGNQFGMWMYQRVSGEGSVSFNSDAHTYALQCSPLIWRSQVESTMSRIKTKDSFSQAYVIRNLSKQSEKTACSKLRSSTIKRGGDTEEEMLLVVLLDKECWYTIHKLPSSCRFYHLQNTINNC